MTRMRSWSVGITLGAALVALAACADPASITRSPDAVQLAKSVAKKKGEPLACATSGRKKAHGTIGPEGGTIAIGNTIFTLPAGAVTAPQKFEVEVPRSQYLEIEVNAKGYDSFQFEKPVTVTVDYSRCSIPDLAKLPIAMFHKDEATGALLEEMNTVVNEQSRTITFTTPHLSVYILAEAFGSVRE